MKEEWIDKVMPKSNGVTLGNMWHYIRAFTKSEEGNRWKIVTKAGKSPDSPLIPVPVLIYVTTHWAGNKNGQQTHKLTKSLCSAQ